MRSSIVLRNELYKPWFVGETDWGFEIVDGEFKDVCIQIEKIDMGEGDANDLKLDYHTIRKPELITDEDLKGQKFQSTIELIINDILKEAIYHYEQTRDDNTSELNT